METVYKPHGDESGPDYILHLDGPDGNVFVLWGIIEKLMGEECVEESKNNGHIELPHEGNGFYQGYKGVLDYMIYMLGHIIEFRMYGHLVQQVSDYDFMLENCVGDEHA